MYIEPLPIGTVFTFHDTEMMIIGSTVAADNEGDCPYYYCVPVPLGFMNEDRIAAIPFDQLNDNIIQVGYCDNEMQSFLDNQKILLQSFVKLGHSKAVEILEDFNKNLEALANE